MVRAIQAHFDPSRNCADAIRSGVLSSGLCVAFSILASCSCVHPVVGFKGKKRSAALSLNSNSVSKRPWLDLDSESSLGNETCSKGRHA